MQRLKFHRYLERYVRSLSHGKTNNIFKLAKEVSGNLRLREPLLLYAYSFDKVDRLLKASANYTVYSEYVNIASKYTWNELMKLLEDNDEKLGELYRKIYRSYINRRNMPETENNVRHLIHKKTRELQESKGVSNYRLYTDLKLNHGNINAYLKYGDIAKVKKETAEKILEYLKAV